ncbi:MAG: hormogonium polysaccharide biosynthesis protein HpsA, partial [Nostoc sp.]
MEVCPSLPVSACNSATPATDWWVTVPGDATYPAGLKASSVIGQTFYLTPPTPPPTPPTPYHKAGTTAQAQSPTGSNPEYLGYPRRVAFLRNASGQLTLDASNQPSIIGIKGGKITSFPLSTFSSSHPDNTANSLWFQSNNSVTTPPTFTLTPTATSQPMLLPVLQIQSAFDTSNETSTTQVGPGAQQDSYWLQWATATTFNLVAAGGDTPARPTEDNGGLHNFVRFLENWNP